MDHFLILEVDILEVKANYTELVSFFLSSFTHTHTHTHMHTRPRTHPHTLLLIPSSWSPMLTSLLPTSSPQVTTSLTASRADAPTETSMLSTTTQTRLQTRSQMQLQSDLNTRQVIAGDSLITDHSAAESSPHHTPEDSRREGALGAEMPSSSPLLHPSGTAAALMTMLSCTFSLLITRLNQIL